MLWLNEAKTNFIDPQTEPKTFAPETNAVPSDLRAVFVLFYD